MASEHEQRDWLAEAATAFDEGDYDKAAAAAQLDQAATTAAIGRGFGENLDGIGNALGDLIKAVRGH